MAGNFEEARTLYDGVWALPGVKNRRERLRQLNNLAYVAVELGDLASAQRYVQEVHRLGGEKSWRGRNYFLATRAALRLAQGRLDGARAEFSEVLTQRGSDVRILIWLAETAYKQGAVDDVAEYIGQIQTEPVEPLLRMRLAAVLGELADIDQAAGHVHLAEDRQHRANALLTPRLLGPRPSSP